MNGGSAGLVVGRLETGRGSYCGGPYDFGLEPGEALQLVGPNGSGKSTLLDTLAGVLPARGGTVRFGDATWEGPGLRSLPPWRRRIGVLFQGLGLWPHLTVRAQARLVAPGADERIERLAERLLLAPLLDRKPAHLSGGEAQRAALLRALAANPPLLLLDEPTSAQHDDTAKVVRGAITEELDRGKMIVIAAHRGWEGMRKLLLDA
jgi:ABC-type sugar transport system ATPase subunit